VLHLVTSIVYFGSLLFSLMLVYILLRDRREIPASVTMSAHVQACREPCFRLASVCVTVRIDILMVNFKYRT
jgi:hypothetical protein